MISVDLIHEVRRLLAQPGLSQRTIARMTGVSRATIGAVASGRRPDYQPRARADEEDDRPQGPPQRCRGCGGLVYLPCRLCRVRAIKAEDRQRALGARGNPFVAPPRVERDRTGERIAH